MYISIISSFQRDLGYDDAVEGCFGIRVYALELRGLLSPSVLKDDEKEEERETFLERVRSWPADRLDG